MKSRLLSTWIAVAAVAAACVVATGCSVMDSVRKQFSQFHEAAIVAGDEPVVYAKSRESLEGMGYVYERGSQSGHRLEMATAIQPGGNAQNLRQRRVILEFRAMGSEGTDVKVGFWELSEETAQKDNAVAGGKLIRGGPLYQAFWDRLGKALPDRPIQPKPDEAAASSAP
jgi:hypothetical protein